MPMPNIQPEIFGEGSGGLTPMAVENYELLRARQTSESFDELPGGGSKKGRVNLLNWDGKGRPAGLFPAKDGE